MNDEITAWKNKWECAVEMAARAEVERDEARKDAAQLADRLSGLELRTTEELARMECERDEAIELLKYASTYSTTKSQEDTYKFLRKINKLEEVK